MSCDETKDLHLIHYGAPAFDPALFLPVTDVDGFFKPEGGLWCSPVGSAFGWKEFCTAECFSTNSLTTSFELRFHGRVLLIDGEEDLVRLEWRPLIPMRDTGIHRPLFEPLVAQGYDAVHLTIRGESATRHTTRRGLYGWDCETVFLLTPHGIMP